MVALLADGEAAAEEAASLVVDSLLDEPFAAASLLLAPLADGSASLVVASLADGAAAAGGAGITSFIVNVDSLPDEEVYYIGVRSILASVVINVCRRYVSAVPSFTRFFVLNSHVIICDSVSQYGVLVFFNRILLSTAPEST